MSFASKSAAAVPAQSRIVWRRAVVIRWGRAFLGVWLLLAWYIAALASGPYSMAGPWNVLVRIVEMARSGILFVDAAVTMEATILGFVIGGVLGLLLPLLLRLSRRLTAAIEPYIMTSMGIPIFALAPLLILWFGINLAPKVVITAVTVFYIIFISMMSGLKSIDGRLVSMARIVGASQTWIVREIYWRSVQPFLFSGLRVALPRAIGATIVGEFLVADRGLGFYIEDARQQADTIGVFTGIVLVTMLVLGMDAILDRLYRRAMAWRPKDPDMTT